MQDLVELCKRDMDSARHQNLNEEFFVPADELSQRELRTISHPWLTKKHPDPNADQLQWIEEQPWSKGFQCHAYAPTQVNDKMAFEEVEPRRFKVLQEVGYFDYYSQYASPVDFPGPRVGEIVEAEHSSAKDWLQFQINKGSAIFIDFCCVPQEGPDGTKRTLDEEQRFEKAISNMELLYANSDTWTYLMDEALEKKTELQHEYEDRGWCFFESEASRLKSCNFQRTSSSGIASAVLAPLCPDAFYEKLEAKHFTNEHTDKKLVAELYVRLFNVTIGQTWRLSFTELAPGSGSEDRLMKLFREAQAMQRLTFDSCAAGVLECVFVTLRDLAATPKLDHIHISNTSSQGCTEEAFQDIIGRMDTMLQSKGWTTSVSPSVFIAFATPHS